MTSTLARQVGSCVHGCGKILQKVKINDQNILHDFILAYARRTVLTNNGMSFKDRILRIRTERHDTTSAGKDNLERSEHLRGKALGILNWEISVTPPENKTSVLDLQSTK